MSDDRLRMWASLAILRTGSGQILSYCIFGNRCFASQSELFPIFLCVSAESARA